MKITIDSIKRFRLAYVEESEGKSDKEIKVMIFEMMKIKRTIDRTIERKVKSYA